MRIVFLTIFSIVAGVIVGSIINMALISLGPIIIEQPERVDMNNFEEAIKKFEFKHFIFPFFAHALGTFFGAFVSSLFISDKKFRALGSILIGVLFLAGGIYMSVILDAPIWFETIDLILAYIPMALIGYSLANKLRKTK